MTTSIVWLRRDLRLEDNVALHEASLRSERLCLAFVIDEALLRSDRVGAPLVQAFFEALGSLRERVRRMGSDVAVLDGDPAERLGALATTLGAGTLFFNEDYEPAAIRRDEAVAAALRARGIEVHACLDHVYFGAGEVAQNDGAPYKVFTPYRKRWFDQRSLARRPPVPSAAAARGKFAGRDALGASRETPVPAAYGRAASCAFPQVTEDAARKLLDGFFASGAADRYRDARDLPAVAGTSRLSPHLRAGTIGIRECVERGFARAGETAGAARASVETWIGELIWRDFYQMILRRFPRVATSAFVEGADGIAWREAPADFAAWCAGRTGYPIVDAAMRQLNATGWMHNRLRMIVASFLTKDLLIDWRLGERYFEQHLADADVAANNGGWQWAASTGTDAAPYFRIFNPVRQSKTFDPSGAFLRSMLPELREVGGDYVHEPWTMPPLLQREYGCEIGRDYPPPLVDHAAARTRALAAFAPVFRKPRG